MIQSFLDYTVEIKNLKFITDSGITIPKTAIIHFTVEGKSKPIVELLGYWDQELIFEKTLLSFTEVCSSSYHFNNVISIIIPI